MATWTVKIGENDVFVIDTDGDGVVMEIPNGVPVKATRAQVEDLRRKLGAALGYEETQG